MRSELILKFLTILLLLQTAHGGAFNYSIKSQIEYGGKTYYFLDRSFLQGQTMALARGDGEIEAIEALMILGTNNGDSPRSWCFIVRPDRKASDAYGQLYVSDTGWVLGLRMTHQCYIAYDTRSSTFYGHGDIEELSPFLLITKDEAPSERDLQELKKSIESHITRILGDSTDIRTVASYVRGAPPLGYPDFQHIELGTKHENERIQSFSKDILNIHQNGLENALCILNEYVKSQMIFLKDHDAQVRYKAIARLGWIPHPAIEPAIPLLLEEIGSEKNGSIASQALALTGDKETLRSLLRLIDDPDPEVRRDVIFGIGMAISRGFGTELRPEFIKSLEQRKEDADSYVKRRANELLREIETQ